MREGQRDREMIEIPLDDHDAELLPPLYESFKSFWSDTSQEPRAQFNTFIAKTPIVDGVVFRPAAASEIPGIWCEPPTTDAERAMLFLHGGGYTKGNADAFRGF